MIPAFLWFVAHNLLAHPLLLTSSIWADRFHTWTGDRAFVADLRIDFEKFDGLFGFLGGVILSALFGCLGLGAVTFLKLLIAAWRGAGL